MRESFKIIETGVDYPDVLISRDRNEKGEEIVNITAFGIQSNIEDIIASESINFGNSPTDLIFDFISDYSVESAQNFCRRNNLTYS